MMLRFPSVPGFLMQCLLNFTQNILAVSQHNTVVKKKKRKLMAQDLQVIYPPQQKQQGEIFCTFCAVNFLLLSTVFIHSHLKPSCPLNIFFLQPPSIIGFQFYKSKTSKTAIEGVEGKISINFQFVYCFDFKVNTYFLC